MNRPPIEAPADGVMKAISSGRSGKSIFTSASSVPTFEDATTAHHSDLEK